MISVSKTQFGDVALVTFANPPLNVLSVGAGLVERLTATLSSALADPQTRAVVIASEGRAFSAGADVKDFDGGPASSDAVRSLLTEVIEAADKPVVAAMQGLALGGGLELALASHHRIAAPQAAFGLPEITLGLIPGAGGTQRLPRLIGVSRALDLILTGRQVDAAAALDLGLIDAVAGEALIPEAIETARGLAGRPPRRTRDLPVAADAEERLPVRRGKFPAAADAVVACIDAARTRPFDEGLALERTLFERLTRSEASQGLRHVFFGRRQVGKIPGAGPLDASPAIRSAAVVGGGVMGVGIANALINAGLSVALIEPRDEARARAVETTRKSALREVEKGRLTPEGAEARVALLSVSPSIEAVAGADLVIEAVFEDMEVKRQVFEAVARHARPDALLASNTSTLDIDAIAAFSGRPESFVGLHFFNPAPVMRLLEVVRGAATSEASLNAALRFARDIGKVGVVSGVCDGFIGNRMFEEYLRQAYFLLEEGCLPAQIDAALEAWGMAMGPLKVMDLAGQDIGWSIRKRRRIEQPDRPYSSIPDALCELGRFGQKTGAGYYLYPDGRTPEPDPVVDRLIVETSRSKRIERRKISDEEIVERCVFALINEGAKILEEKIAYRSVDIDIVYVFGYGFPAERGGPMFYGDKLGADYVVNRMREFERGRNAWSWKPAPLLLKLAAAGGRVGALTAA